MTLIRFTLSLFFGILFSFNTFSQSWQQEFVHSNGKPTRDFHEIQQWADRYFHDVEEQIDQKRSKGEYVTETMGEQYSQYFKYKRWEWFWHSRLNSEGRLGAFSREAVEKARKFRSAKSSATWKCISFTSNSGGYWGMGRVDALGFHPTDPGIFYVGSIGGGLWKTTDGGLTFRAINKGLPLTQVGHIVVDYENPDVVYVTQGPQGGWWTHNMGVYKSVDGGQSFSPTVLSYSYAFGKPIEDMVMSPTDPKVLLVSGSDGIYKTTNGGKYWTQVYDKYVTDLEWKPNDGNTIYAVRKEGKVEVLKSVDEGLTWSQITDIGTSRNNILLAVTAADSNMVAYQSRAENNGIFLSTDNGEHFTHQSDGPEMAWGFYISPYDPDIMYIGQVSCYQSTNRGKTFHQISHWYDRGDLPAVHADVRYMGHHPAEEGAIYFGNDGGVSVYDEQVKQWREYQKGLVITQYYRLACAQSDPNIVQGGTQDNGGNRRDSTGNWYNTNGGDAMVQAIDPENANIMYTTYINGKLFRSDHGGRRGNGFKNITPELDNQKIQGAWVTPYMLDPQNSQVLVAGYEDVWRSTNRGDSWKRISNNLTGGKNLHNIAVSPVDTAAVYASRGSVLYKTVDLGQSWDQHRLPGSETITRLAVSDVDDDILWATRGGYTEGEKVYQSVDGGVTWANISGTLPNIPVNAIIYEKGSNEALYIGSDKGVYYRNGAMDNWIRYSKGLPNTICNDFDIHYGSRMLRLATYGRGIWEIPLLEPFSSAPEADFKTNTTRTCTGKIRFTDRSSDAHMWHWDFGDGTSSGKQNPVHVYTKPGVYSVKLTASNTRGQDRLTRQNYIEVEIPRAPSVQGAEACQGSEVTLSATGQGTLHWYESYTGNELLHAGNRFTPAELQDSNTYYVSDRIQPAPHHIGPQDSSFYAGTCQSEHTGGLLFDAMQPLTIQTVKVYSAASSEHTFELREGKGGSLLDSLTTEVPEGEQLINLDFEVEAGTGYFLTLGESPGSVNLYQNTGGAEFPYSQRSNLSITSNGSEKQPDHYPYFYDWEVQEKGCFSQRIPVTAKIQTNPSPTIEENEGTLKTDSSYALYQWLLHGSPIEHATNSYLTPPHDGNYAVKVTNVYGCTTTSDPYLFIDVVQYPNTNDSTNVSDSSITTEAAIWNESEGVRVFPNPADRMIHVIAPGTGENVLIQLLDMEGRLLIQEQIPGNRNEIMEDLDVEDFSSGMYLLKITTGHGTSNRKIILE